MDKTISILFYSQSLQLLVFSKDSSDSTKRRKIASCQTSSDRCQGNLTEYSILNQRYKMTEQIAYELAVFHSKVSPYFLVEKNPQGIIVQRWNSTWSRRFVTHSFDLPDIPFLGNNWTIEASFADNVS